MKKLWLTALLFCSCGPDINSGLIYMKEYIPERRWTTTETHKVNQATYITVHHHHSPSKHLLWVRGEINGKVVTRSFSVSPETYNSANPGDLYNNGHVTKPKPTLE